MKIKTLMFMAATTMLVSFASCKKDSVIDASEGFGEDPIAFSSNIIASQIRAQDTSWDANDAIGVFAVRSGGIINTTIPSSFFANNNMFVTSKANGKFEAATEKNRFAFPADGSKIDVVAYYPYTEAMTGNLVKVDVTDQTNPAAIDLLYANNLLAVNKATEKSLVKLTFKHKLAKIVFQFAEGTKGISSATLNGFNTIAYLNVSNGDVTAKESAKEINAVVHGSSGPISAIIAPGPVSRGTLSVVKDGVTYTYKMLADQVFSSGTLTVISATIDEETGEIIVLDPDGSITDWEDDGGGSLYPEGEVPDNTLEIGSNELDFSWAGGEQLVSLRASDGLSWSARSSDESWLNVSPASGTASGTLKLIATANTVEAARTATVTISASGSSGALSQTLTVRQAGKTQTGEEETYYLEDFNSFTEKVFLTPTTGEEQTTNINGVDFVATGKLDVRDTKTLDWHLWYAANSDTRLIIKKGNEGHTANKLSFDVAANIFNDSDSFDVANLEVKVGGASFSIPSRVISKPNGDDLSTYVHVELTGLPDSFTEFEINAKAATNKIGVRVDNIKLVGVN